MNFGDLIAQCELPRHELWPLLETASGRARESILAHPDHTVEEPARLLFQRWVQQRQDGVPVAYLTGYREFYGRRFWVNRSTLIPRIETELLIDMALSVVRKDPREALAFCDVGTGCGSIATTLALEIPTAAVTATDLSAHALAVARNNAAWLGAADRIEFHEGAWWAPLVNSPKKFHGILSNPPYIEFNDPHLREGDLRYEPALALTGQGPKEIATLVMGAPERLLPNGFLLIEHGCDQQAMIKGLFESAGLIHIQTVDDSSHQPRAVLGFKSPE